MTASYLNECGSNAGRAALTAKALLLGLRNDVPGVGRLSRVEMGQVAITAAAATV